MSKFDCEIIKDLLPLYADNVCSEKSTECVEEHLKECSECSEELRKIKECPIVPEVDEDLKNAVKNAGKRIKKAKKKTVIETIALVLILVFLFGVIGMYRFILYSAKQEYNEYNKQDNFYSVECESVSVDLINKRDYENDSATIFVGEKYKVEKYEDKTQKLIINKDKYIRFIEHENGLMVYGMSEYLEERVFFPAKPFVKWGVELWGYNSDFAPGYDLSLEEKLLETDEPDAPFFCSYETYAKALAYYTIRNSMGKGNGYLLVKNPEFICIGTIVRPKEDGKYSFIIQSKEDQNKSMQINFFGYESQDEVLDVLSSLKIK